MKMVSSSSPLHVTLLAGGTSRKLEIVCTLILDLSLAFFHYFKGFSLQVTQMLSQFQINTHSFISAL